MRFSSPGSCCIPTLHLMHRGWIRKEWTSAAKENVGWDHRHCHCTRKNFHNKEVTSRSHGNDALLQSVQTPSAISRLLPLALTSLCSCTFQKLPQWGAMCVSSLLSEELNEGKLSLGHHCIVAGIRLLKSKTTKPSFWRLEACFSSSFLCYTYKLQHIFTSQSLSRCNKRSILPLCTLQGLSLEWIER